MKKEQPEAPTETSPPDTTDEVIREARHNIGVLTNLLRNVATCEISCSEPIEGATIDWLALQIDLAVDRIELAEMNRRKGDV